jgi:two-component system sensor histidine kinase KdpD
MVSDVVSELRPKGLPTFWSWDASAWKGLFPSVWLVAATSALGMLISELNGAAMTAPTLTLMFVVPVVISAVFFGFWPALLATALGVVSWDYLFDRPYFTLSITDPRDVLAAIAFLVVSLLVSALIAPVRRQKEQLAKLADSLSHRYAISQKLSRLATVEAIATFLSVRATELAGCEALVLVSGRNRMPEDFYPRGYGIAIDEVRSARQFMDGTLPAEMPGRIFLPLDGHRGRSGVLYLRGANLRTALEQNVDSIGELTREAAVAIERAILAEKIEDARMPAAEPSESYV